MTAAAAKIPAGPTSFSTDVTLKSLVTLKDWKAESSTFLSQTSSWVSEVTVSLVGQADASKEPAKTMNTWYTTNQTAITGQSLTS
jgi:hypothetical protein